MKNAKLVQRFSFLVFRFSSEIVPMCFQSPQCLKNIINHFPTPTLHFPFPSHHLFLSSLHFILLSMYMHECSKELLFCFCKRSKPVKNFFYTFEWEREGERKKKRFFCRATFPYWSWLQIEYEGGMKAALLVFQAQYIKGALISRILSIFYIIYKVERIITFYGYRFRNYWLAYLCSNAMDTVF